MVEEFSDDYDNAQAFIIEEYSSEEHYFVKAKILSAYNKYSVAKELLRDVKEMYEKKEDTRYIVKGLYVTSGDV